MDKIYDYNCLLKWNGGDDELAHQLIALFIEVIPESRDNLKKASLAKDWDKIFKSAHKMKASIDMFGIYSLEKLIREIEEQGRHSTDSPTLITDVQHVTDVIDNCIAQMKKDFSIEG